MDNTIIECSCFDAVDATSNASWKTNLTKGVVINEGDIITIRNCFINSNTSDAENIEIPEDLTLNLDVGYYDINYGTLSSAGLDNIDYDYYIAYNENIGTVATLTGLTFRCIYSSQPFDNWLYASASFRNTSGYTYKLTWGVDVHTQDPVPIPKPPSGSHINVSVALNYPNIIISTLKVDNGLSVSAFLGPSWIGSGQGGLSLNTGNVEIIVPKGEYTRAGIAKYITDNLQLAQKLYKDPILEIGNDMLRRTDQGQNHVPFTNYIVNDPLDQAQVILSESFANVDAVKTTGLNFGSTVTLEYTLYDVNNEAISRQTKTATIESEANDGIDVQVDQTVIIKFTTNIFDLDDIYRLGIMIVQVTVQPTVSNLVFQRVGYDPTDANTKRYIYPNPTFYGSSENVLAYDEDRSVFTFQYLHMPYYGSNPPTICIRQEKNTTVTNNEAYNKYYTVSQLGGVFFINLTPMSFWESLGFTSDQLIVPVQPNLMINRADLVNRITSGYSSLASIIDISNPKQINLNIANDIATTDTIEIYGKSLDDVSTGGFYLVDVNLGGGQNYLFQGGNKNNIQAIVSKYNQIRDYVTGYSDSSIGYQHVGVPYELQTISVNILDPETKLPDQNIGSKSTIFLQITKNSNAQETT